METLDQIETREHEQRQRAWSYQSVVADLDRYRSMVARLTPQLDAISGILHQLNEIQELAAKLPRDLTGTGAVICRDQIQMTTSAAAKGLANRRERLKRQLDPALTKIPALEKQILSFESNESTT
jgi:hypothetical protein